MSVPLTRIGSLGLLFLLIFLSGFWLSRSGKPYGVILFSFHKLIAVGTLVLLVVTLFKNRPLPLSGAVPMIAVAVTILGFAAMLVSGGFISIDKPVPAAVALIHKLVPYMTVLASGASLYLLR